MPVRRIRSEIVPGADTTTSVARILRLDRSSISMSSSRGSSSSISSSREDWGDASEMAVALEPKWPQPLCQNGNAAPSNRIFDKKATSIRAFILAKRRRALEPSSWQRSDELTLDCIAWPQPLNRNG